MQKDFSKQLIKGKIAELVFEQMFREAEKYTVIPFGYESIVSELQQYTRQMKDQAVLDNIRNAPDFALVSHDPKEVFLVEVKYRSRIDGEEIRKTAATICERWKLAYIFIATPEAFYFDKCSELARENSTLTEIPDSLISKDVQEKYLALLTEFIKS